MSNKTSVSVAVPTSVVAGAASDVENLVSVRATLVGAMSATYQGQYSSDGTNWVNTGSALTAAGDLAVPDIAKLFRWNCTAYTSGTPVSSAEGTAKVKRQGSIAVPTSVVAGAAQDISDLTNVKVDLGGAMSATYAIEYSEDNTHFVSAGSLTAAGEVSVPDCAKQVRVNCTAYVSGTPVGAFGGTHYDAGKAAGTVAVPVSVVAGAATDVEHVVSARAQLVGAMSATYQGQYTEDGTNWVNTGSALTAAGDLAIPDAAKMFRWNCTAYVSGTPAGTYGGTLPAT
jgi:hypothetical protein